MEPGEQYSGGNIGPHIAGDGRKDVNPPPGIDPKPKLLCREDQSILQYGYVGAVVDLGGIDGGEQVHHGGIADHGNLVDLGRIQFSRPAELADHGVYPGEHRLL